MFGRRVKELEHNVEFWKKDYKLYKELHNSKAREYDCLKEKNNEQTITIKHHEARIKELEKELDGYNDKEVLIKKMAKLILAEQDETNYNNLVEQITHALRVNN